MLTQAFAKLHALRGQSEILFSKWMESRARTRLNTYNERCGGDESPDVAHIRVLYKRQWRTNVRLI